MSMLDAGILGPEIARRRKARELTQEQLGKRLGVTAQAVSRWENGESLPDVTLLPGLCRLLEISADKLLGIDGSDASDTKGEVYVRSSSVYGSISLVFLFSLILGLVFRNANPMLTVVPVIMMSVIAIVAIIKGMQAE